VGGNINNVLRVVSIITRGNRNSAGTPVGSCRKIQHGSNYLQNAGGTPLAAASSCVTELFRDVVANGKRLQCVASRYGMMETTR